MALPIYHQNWDASGSLPVDWNPGTTFAVGTTTPISGSRAIQVTGANTGTTFVLQKAAAELSANGTASLYTRVNQPRIIGVQARAATESTWGANSYTCLLAHITSSPLFILRKNPSVVLGTDVALGADWTTGIYYCIELRVVGTTISCRCRRKSDGFWLKSDGTWDASPQVAQSLSDSTFSAAGKIGIVAADIPSGTDQADDIYWDAPAPVLDDASVTLGTIGSTQTVTAGGFSDPLAGVTWDTDNHSIATVNSSGVVTAVAAGSCTLTATGVADTGQTATATVTVSLVPTVAPTTITIDQLATVTLSASNFTGGTVTWASNSTGHATVVAGTGVVTGVAHAQATDQTATITATGVANGAQTATCVVTVRAVDIDVSPATPNVPPGGTITVVATVTGSTNTAKTFSLVSGGGSVDSGTGVYTAPATNTVAVIRATSTADSGQAADATITVAATYFYTSQAPYGIAYTGLALGYTVYDSDAAVAVAHTTANVNEVGVTGNYIAVISLPLTSPRLIVWDAPVGLDPYTELVQPMRSNLVQSLGVTIANEFCTIASATSTTITFPTLDSSGNTIPADGSLAWTQIAWVEGTGTSQQPVLTTWVSSRTYNVLSGTMATPFDSTTKVVIGNSVRSNTSYWLGVAPASLNGGRVEAYTTLMRNDTISDNVISTSVLVTAAQAVLSAALVTPIQSDVALVDGQTANAAAAVTFPSGTIANTTNITTIGAVSGAVGSVTGNVGGNVTGNVGGSVASVTAGVTVTTNSDKTGYALTVTPPTAAANAAAVLAAADATPIAADMQSVNGLGDRAVNLSNVLVIPNQLNALLTGDVQGKVLGSGVGVLSGTGVTAGLADGAITDAKFTVPAEGTTPPTGIVGKLAWIAARLGLRRFKRTATGIDVYQANGTTVQSHNDYTLSGADADITKAT